MSLPLTIIGGYLGSGKTTLLNHMLRRADGLRLAVLVNEFGDLPIDADLIEAEDGNMISIAGGCVCCSFGDDLSAALMDLAKLEPAPDHVLLETSGVALPGAIAASLVFTQGYTHDATIVLTNAETIQAQAQDTYVGDTIQRQLCDADLIILNKIDLVSDAALAKTKGWLAQEYAQAEILTAQNGRLPLDVLLQSYLGRAGRPIAVPQPHPDIFKSVDLSVEKPVDAQALAASLASADLGLARAKGFVTDRSGQQMTLQVVGRRCSTDPAPEGVANGLVVIAEAPRVDKDQLQALVARHQSTI